MEKRKMTAKDNFKDNLKDFSIREMFLSYNIYGKLIIILILPFIIFFKVFYIAVCFGFYLGEMFEEK